MRLEDKAFGIASTSRFMLRRERMFDRIGGPTTVSGRRLIPWAWERPSWLGCATRRVLAPRGEVLPLRAKTRGATGMASVGLVPGYPTNSDVRLLPCAQRPQPAVLAASIPCRSWQRGCGSRDRGPSARYHCWERRRGSGHSPQLVEQVAVGTEAAEVSCAWGAELASEGAPIRGLFPVNAEWKVR